MKTDNPEHVGKHAFELAGLGKAPFRFLAMSENVRTSDGSARAGGCCDYCFTGIRTEFHIISADGKRSKVGCDCINKHGDEGLIKAYKNSPQFRAKQRELRQAKAAAILAELKAIIGANVDRLKSEPHPAGYLDRETKAPLTRFDWATWMLNNCGAAGQRRTLKALKAHLGA